MHDLNKILEKSPADCAPSELGEVFDALRSELARKPTPLTRDVSPHLTAAVLNQILYKLISECTLEEILTISDALRRIPGQPLKATVHTVLQ